MALKPVPPEQMSRRARLYLLAAAFRHGGTALLLLCLPWQFEDPAFDTIFGLMPRPCWVAVLGAGGAWLACAAWQGSPGSARLALVLSVFVTGLWLGAFTTAAQRGVATWIGVIWCAAFVWKDLIQCAQPLRAPFDRLTREPHGSTSS